MQAMEYAQNKELCSTEATVGDWLNTNGGWVSQTHKHMHLITFMLHFCMLNTFKNGFFSLNTLVLSRYCNTTLIRTPLLKQFKHLA